MRHLRDRAMSLFLACTLTLSLLPSAALAAEEAQGAPPEETSVLTEVSGSPVLPAESPAASAQPLPTQGVPAPEESAAPEETPALDGEPEAAGPVMLESEGPEEIGSAEALGERLAAAPGGAYLLTDDIALPGDWTALKNFSGSLDGNGHTVTLAGAPLFDTIEEGAEVRNLVLNGTVELDEDDQGPLALKNLGRIHNCASLVEVYGAQSYYDMSGLVGSHAGGTISNCLVAGTIQAFSVGRAFAGGVGTAGTVAHSYWSTTSGADMPCAPPEKATDCGGKTPAELKDPAFLALMDGECGEDGIAWGYTDQGVPVPGGPNAQPPAQKEVDVGTAEELSKMSGDRYTLTADIDLRGGAWTPIAKFSGVLDGNGHTVTLDGAPLFQALDWEAEVKNLLIAGRVASDGDAVGALAGTSAGTVRNCFASAEVSTTDKWTAVGGLVGTIQSGSISNCLSIGELTGSKTLGGIAGEKDWGADFSVTNCYWSNAEKSYSGGSASGRVAQADLSLAPLAGRLNAHLADGDLTWGLSGGVLVPGGTGTPGAPDRSGLEAQVAEIAAMDRADGPYTGASWAKLEAALKAARDTLADPESLTGDLAGAGAALAAAVAALQRDWTGEVTRDGLIAQIAAAEKLAYGLYTDGSWDRLQKALNAARSANDDPASDQKTLDARTAALKAAVESLALRATTPAAAPDGGVVELDQEAFLALGADWTGKGLEAGKFYRLTEDVTVSPDTDVNFWMGVTVNGTLDGGGHVITVDQIGGFGDTYVLSEIGESGVVQNLGVEGSGLLALENAGLLVNCWSLAAGPKNGFGLVQNLTGGAIVNCWAAGPLANLNGSSRGLLKYAYWPSEAAQAPEAGDSLAVVGCGEKTLEELHSKDFVELLDAHRGTHGLSWGRDEKLGWPRHGEDHDFIYVPAVTYDVRFAPQDGSAPYLVRGKALELYLSDVDEAGQAGTFSLPDYEGEVIWSTENLGAAGSNKVMVQHGTGGLWVFGVGEARIRAFAAEDVEEETPLATFRVAVTEPENAELKVTWNGENVTGQTITLQGSEWISLGVMVRAEGQADFHTVEPNTVSWSSDQPDKVSQYGFRLCFNQPGDAVVTAAGMGGSASVTVRSEYVPVASITPGMSGEYILHGRNANSNGSGDFLDLKLMGASNVVVLPSNASYRDRWTLTSSDPSVAEYVSSMIAAVLPKRPGTVTLTAATDDPGLEQQHSSQTTVTLKYFNPITALTASEPELSVKVGERLDLPLTFTGPESANGYHVTEAGMNWTYEGGGAVEIARDAPGMVIRTDKEYCVSDDRYHVTGVREGVVTAIGTPVDQTNHVAPVRFTITVTAGEERPPVDYDALVSAGIAGAQGHIYGVYMEKDYGYNSEWDVFALCRSGGAVSAVQRADYLASAEAWLREHLDRADTKPTDLERVALALGALGEDLTDFRGMDLIGGILNSNKLGDGSNESIYALLALDTGSYAGPEGAKWTRQGLIDEIIDKYQNDDGGFGLNDNKTAGVDMTAMAVQALAPYASVQGKVRAGVDRALDYLRAQQRFDGGYGTPESAGQVLVALTSLGLDPLDPEQGFVKGGGDLLTSIASFQLEGGGFAHGAGEDAEVDAMATVQALYSLESYRRYQSGGARLYDFTDTDPRSMLEKRVKAAGALAEKDYTPETWAPFTQALQAARDLLKDAAAPDEALAAADAALADAIAALKRSASPDPGPTPGGKIGVTFRLVGATQSETGKIDMADGVYDSEYRTWIATRSYAMEKGDTVYDLFVRATEEAGLSSVGAEDNYVKTITAPTACGGYDLSEFTNGRYSGWMYTVNGPHPNVGLKARRLQDGDEVVWHYVNDYRYEVEDWSSGSRGDESTWSRWLDAADADPTGKGGGASSDKKDDPATELSPEVTVDKKTGEAKAEVTSKELAAAVKQAKADKTTAIVIAPDVKKDTPKVSVTIPGDAASALAKEKDLKLAVKTPQATVTLTGAALSGLKLDAKTPLTVSCETLAGQIGIELKAGSKSVEAVEGGVGVAIPVEKATSGTVLMLVTADGAKIVQKSAVDGKTLKAVLGGSATVTVKDNSKVFGDVPAEHWAAEPVNFAASHELFQGTGDGAFSPAAPMSRAMLMTVLARLEGQETAGGETWYSQAMAWAQEQGVSDGTAPDSGVTREQLAVMLYRYAGEPEAKGDTSKFADTASVSDWASDGMAWAVGAGLITGKDGGALDPAGQATRAEVATILQRLMPALVG